MYKKNISIFVLLTLCRLLIPFTGMAQTEQKTLNEQELTAIVKRFHPVARQAELAIERSKAEITSARGSFDPVLSNFIGSKTFDGTEYYSDIAPTLEIPTWYGIELYTGFENLTGNRLNPSSTSGVNSFAGISVPLAKDLVMDKRRAFLQQARIMNKLAEQERRMALNDLVRDACMAYYEWEKSYRLLQLTDTIISVNRLRFEIIKKTVELGERPPVDTTEALAQLQNFLLLQNQRKFDLLNAGFQLSAFLWKENGEPFDLPSEVVPFDQGINIMDLASNPDEWTWLAMKGHPELMALDRKLNYLEVEKKLKFQDLLPTIDFKYNLLSKDYYNFKDIGSSLRFENNYQYGITMGIPLRLSEGRGEFQKARINISDNRLKRNMKEREIRLNITSCWNELIALNEQVGIQQKNIRNFQLLADAEVIRFNNGESSVFLINARETAALSAKERLIDLKAKLNMKFAGLRWSAGSLN